MPSTRTPRLLLAAAAAYAVGALLAVAPAGAVIAPDENASARAHEAVQAAAPSTGGGRKIR